MAAWKKKKRRKNKKEHERQLKEGDSGQMKDEKGWKKERIKL